MTEWFTGLIQATDRTQALHLLWLAAGTLVSEDIACIAAGLLVAHGALAFPTATAACFAGIFVGDLLLVWLGRTVGRRSLEAVPFRWWISAEAVHRAERWFLRRGPGLMLASRFMPGTRLPTYVATGVLRVPLRNFVGWFALACALWTPLLVGTAVLVGDGAQRLFESWAHATPALLLAGFAAWLAKRAVTSLGTWRGRRLFLSRWRRLTRWEFWPMWAVYPPVVAYIVWL
jgi:membrane protein DedA with SNARE-associated domain